MSMWYRGTKVHTRTSAETVTAKELMLRGPNVLSEMTFRDWRAMFGDMFLHERLRVRIQVIQEGDRHE